MKEELKIFLREKHCEDCWYGASSESWDEIIDEFFDQYQEENRKSEKSCNHRYCVLSSRKGERLVCVYCDHEIKPKGFKLDMWGRDAIL